MLEPKFTHAYVHRGINFLDECDPDFVVQVASFKKVQPVFAQILTLRVYVYFGKTNQLNLQYEISVFSL